MKNIRIGIFGLKRGASYIESILENNGDIVAVCDKNTSLFEDVRKKLGDNVKCCESFEEFFDIPMDAVFLANYFHEHAQYAIRFLEKGVHVLSECTSNSTMAEGVALVRAAEKSDAFYMIAENYPFMQFNREIRRVCKGGSLGKILYGEGEYNHPSDPYTTEPAVLHDGEKHWRNFLPRSYYITHSLGPLMYATGANPVRVTAMATHAPFPEDSTGASYVADRSAIVTCLNDDDSVFKITGCAGYGAHSNSYRVCGIKGQIENIRGTDGKIMLRYNEWDIPEGLEEINYYQPEIEDKDIEFIKKAGHGGGDFYVIRTFFECLRNNERPEMDEYFATRMASVAILSHRSVLEGGVPYDIPDFRNEEDRKKYENDTESPFWYSDGKAPTVRCSFKEGYKPTEKQIENFKKRLL